MDILIFIASLVALAGIYAMLSLTLNINGGLLGLWDLGLVGFFALGAYAYVLTTVEAPDGLGLPMIVGVAAAGVISAIGGLIIGLASLRLRSEYLLITTFAFAEVIRQVIMNEAWLTKGLQGFYGLARPFEASVNPQYYIIFFAVMVLVLLGLYYWYSQKLAYSPMGRLIRAVRDNEAVSMSIGKDIFRTKLKVFVLTSGMFGLIGSVYVWFSTMIEPYMFTSHVTFTVWTAMVLGGIGNNKGAVLGAFVLIIAQELTRFIPVSPDKAILVAGVRVMLTGFLLIFVLRYMPHGILPEKFESIETRLNMKPVEKGGRSDVASEGA